MNYSVLFVSITIVYGERVVSSFISSKSLLARLRASFCIRHLSKTQKSSAPALSLANIILKKIAHFAFSASSNGGSEAKEDQKEIPKGYTEILRAIFARLLTSNGIVKNDERRKSPLLFERT